METFSRDWNRVLFCPRPNPSRALPLPTMLTSVLPHTPGPSLLDVFLAAAYGSLT
ncbi:MAG: hypothetical protein ACUVRV_01970 [Cyanobacteriota bacterium]